jgi:hypothetical protein
MKNKIIKEGQRSMNAIPTRSRNTEQRVKSPARHKRINPGNKEDSKGERGSEFMTLNIAN